MDIEKIQALIKFVSKSGVTEVELETEEFKIIIKADGAKTRGRKQEEPQVIQTAMPVMPAMAQPMMQQMPTPAAPAPVAEAAPAPPAKKEEENNYITVKSPMIGTFYRSPSPDKPAFVEVGDTIKPGSVLCIVEAMKLFNEVEAEVSGKIIKVLVDDATPIEYDQPLFLVEP